MSHTNIPRMERCILRIAESGLTAGDPKIGGVPPIIEDTESPSRVSRGIMSTRTNKTIINTNRSCVNSIAIHPRNYNHTLNKTDSATNFYSLIPNILCKICFISMTIPMGNVHLSGNRCPVRNGHALGKGETNGKSMRAMSLEKVTWQRRVQSELPVPATGGRA